MFRILLDPKCTAPFCLSPFRGYQTVCPDDVLCNCHCKSRNPYDWSRALPTDRSHQQTPTLRLSPLSFWQKLQWAPTHRGPQHSPLVLASTFKFNRPLTGERYDEPRLASWSLLYARRWRWGSSLWPCYHGLSLAGAMPPGPYTSLCRKNSEES